MSPFSHLSSPLDTGPLRLRNRIALLPQGVFSADPPNLVPADALAPRDAAVAIREGAAAGAAIVALDRSTEEGVRA